MNTVDMRKIYILEIVKQTKVNKYIDTQSLTFWPKASVSYHWNYEQTGNFGLFVKTMGGFKHILTNTIYPLPSKNTGLNYVVNPDNITLFVQEEGSLANHLYVKNKSYKLSMDEIEHLEERINKERSDRESHETPEEPIWQ